MAGPSLQLGVSAAGQDTLAGLNAELVALRGNLAALKAGGKTDLAGLADASKQLTLLRKDISNGQAGLQTAFADLAETIKGGFSKVATEQQQGGARARSLAAAERQANQALYDEAIKAGARFTATEIAQIRAGGVQVVEAERQVAAARAAVLAQSNRTLGEFRNPPPKLGSSTAADSEITAAYAQRQREMATEAARIKAQAWIQADARADAEIYNAHLQGFRAFALQEKALARERRDLARETAALERSGIAAGTTLANENISARDLAIKRAREINEAATIEADAKAAWIRKMQAGSLAIAEAQAAADDAWRARLQVGSLKISDAQAAAAKKESEAAIAAANETAAAIRKAGEIKAAALEAEANRIRVAEARYQAAGSIGGRLSGGQANTQIAARAQLQQGVPFEAVKQNFGETAAAAAQAAGSLEALRAAHVKAGAAAEEHLPKLKGLTNVMTDAHSAARGLASGFGAMFLTWGNIAPLLAGAALSNAFVQTVREGAAVEQVLSVIKYQSEETDGAINNLRTRLLALAAVGPQGPKEIAEAMKALSLAGLTAAQVAVSVKDALTLSVVGEMPAEKAAESLVAISTAYGYSVGQFSRVNDVMAKTAAISMSSVSGMTESFRVSSVVAQQYGVKLEDMATALALVANIGIRNQNAGTAVTQFYAGLAGTTKKGSDALHALGIDSLDAAGKMRSLDDIAQQLVKSLSKLDPKEQVKAVAAAFNNRGQRAEGAIVSAMVTPAKDDETGAIIRRDDGAIKSAAGNIVTVFQETQRKVEESYGFAIIAMAGMSLSAENQMKSVASAFQGALVSAFQELQPSILLVSRTLREAFNSGEFQSALQGLVLTIGNLTVFLVQHAGVLLDVVKAWLLWKGAMIGASVFTALATGVSALAAAFVAMRAGTLLAASGFTVLQASLGFIGLALGALTAAWLYYKTISSDSSTSAAAVASASTAEMIKTLEKESDKIDARNQLLRDGVTAREADIRMAAVQAQADMAQVQGKARGEAGGNLDAKQKELDAAREQLSKLPEKSTALEDVFLNSANQRIIVANRVNRLEQERNDLLRTGAALSRQQLQDQKDLQLAQMVVRAAQMEATRLDQPLAPKPPAGTGKFDLNKNPGMAEASDLQLMQTIYQRDQADIKRDYDNQLKLQTAYLHAKMINEVDFDIAATHIAENKYNAERSRLGQFIDESQGLLTKLQALPADKEGRRNKAELTIDTQNRDAQKQLQQLDFEKQTYDIELKRKDIKITLGIDEFLTKQQSALVKARELAQAKVAFEQLTPNERAMEQARITEEAKFDAIIDKTNVALAEREKTLARLYDLARIPDRITAEQMSDLEKAQAEVKYLQEQVKRLTVSQSAAGLTAMNTLAVKQIPKWEENLASWRNTVGMMEKAYNDMLDGIQKAGEMVWVRFMKTGKLSASELLDVVRDLLAKKLYEETIAPGLTQIAGKLAGALFGNQASASGNKLLGNPVDIAAGKTAATLDMLTTTAITPTITVFENLIMVANQLGSAMASAAGGGGGVGGFFGSLFGGGGGSGTHNTDMANQEGAYPIMDALGGAYGGGRYAFAKGGHFTNQTFAQPTRFSFGGGAAIGEMGEAGPEAVMPLKRGPDGSLGVMNHAGGGGQQQSSNVSVVIENHSGGAVSKRETKKGDGSREIRFIIDAAVDEVANSIAGGGKVGSAIESTYGSNRAAGLPRR